MSRMDAIKKQKEQGSSGFSDQLWYLNEDLMEDLGIVSYRATENTNWIRIIPPLADDVYFGQKIFVHYNQGPSNHAFLCPNWMRKELPEEAIEALQVPDRCPICERWEELKAEGLEKEELKPFSCFPPRFLFLILDAKDKESVAKGPQLYDCPQKINKEILILSENRRTGEMIDVSDPKKGRVVVFDRAGKKATNTTYSGFCLEDTPMPLKEEDMNLPPIWEFLVFATVEEMEKAVQPGRKQEKEEPPTQREETVHRARRSFAAPPKEEPKEEEPEEESEMPESVQETINEEKAKDVREAITKARERLQRRRSS